jgi:hypothetical protein
MTVTVNMEEVMEMESGMGKGTRKPSDMNAPKRPMSAFFQWANKTRPSIMKEHPEWGVAEIGKKLGSMWKKVPKSEVEEFQVKYDKAKKVFDGKMEKYKKGANYRKFQTELLAWKIHVTKKPFGADPNAPKRSLSAYMLYAASVRDQIIKENPEITAAEVMKEQSVWWKALSEAQRKPWNDKAATAKAKYDKQLAKYQKTSDYQKYVKEKEEYKTLMIAKRNKLMGIKLKKKRARNEDDDKKKAKKAKRSSSRKSSRRRSARRARTPKAPKRRPRTSQRQRKAARRRARAPKGTKRRASSRSASTSKSASRRRSVRRARTPKAPRRKSSRASSRRSSTRSTSRRSSKKRSSRRSRTPKSSKRRAAKRRSASRRSSRSAAKRSRSKKSKRSTSRRSSRSVRRSKTPKRRTSRRRASKKRAATPAAPASVVEVDTGAESSAY